MLSGWPVFAVHDPAQLPSFDGSRQYAGAVTEQKLSGSDRQRETSIAAKVVDTRVGQQRVVRTAIERIGEDLAQAVGTREARTQILAPRVGRLRAHALNRAQVNCKFRE